MSILLLDDNPAILQMLGFFLRLKGGYRVLEAITQKEALLQCERRRTEIDLLIADVCIGGQVGRGVADQCLALCPHLPVLFISGYPREHLVGNGSLEPGDAFLAKPFAPDTLLRRVSEVLAGSHRAQNGNAGASRVACAGAGAP
jgi:two-component system, cell cycle sensor histidine kinase and response regulator CckA